MSMDAQPPEITNDAPAATDTAAPPKCGRGRPRKPRPEGAGERKPRTRAVGPIRLKNGRIRVDFWVEFSIAQILKLYAGHGVGAIVRHALADYLAAECPDLPQFAMRGGRFCPSVGRVKCVAAIDEVQLRAAELLAANKRTQFAGENQFHALLRRALAWFIARQMSPEYAPPSTTNVHLDIDGMEAVSDDSALDAPPPSQPGGSLN